VLGYRFVLRDAFSDAPVIEIVARAPEAGGFAPEAIRVPAGRPVRLRFAVPDVTHGIAIGPGLGVDLGHIDPGRVREAWVTFERPGRYTFYCNTWCSPSHWRMRGTIEVYDPARPDALAFRGPDPVMESLPRSHRYRCPTRGARHLRVHRGPARAACSSGWARGCPPDDGAGVETRPQPCRAWDVQHGCRRGRRLGRGRSSLGGRDRDERREQAAGLPRGTARRATARRETARGRAPTPPRLRIAGHAGGALGRRGWSPRKAKSPVAFADARASMLGGTSEIYYAKLRRGGMGTGMPAFGPLFTPEESWALVDHVWALVFGAAPPLPRATATR
jgi:plastocyanin